MASGDAYSRLLRPTLQILLRSIGSLHFEKLRGKRKHEYSIKINDQFRLIFQIEPGDDGNRLVITDIEKHYE